MMRTTRRSLSVALALSMILYIAAIFFLAPIETERIHTVTALQWNSHFECFLVPGCAVAASAFARNQLTANKVDFGNFINFEYAGFKSAKPWPELPPAYKTLGGPACREGFTDSLLLVYNAERWQPIDSSAAEVGCLFKLPASSGDKDARAFAAQAFRDATSGVVLIVLAVHYPHDWDKAKRTASVETLKAALRALGGDAATLRVLLLADANVSFETPSATLLNELGLQSKPEQTSRSWRTCCFGDGFRYAGDRIVSNFGRLHSEVRPMAEDEPVPAWADFSLTKEQQQAGTSGSLTGGNEMHKPVIATFEFTE